MGKMNHIEGFSLLKQMGMWSGDNKHLALQQVLLDGGMKNECGDGRWKRSMITFGIVSQGFCVYS